MNNTLSETITLKNEKEIRLINVEVLHAVEVKDYYCTFHVENKKNFTCTKSLKEIEGILPNHFLKISRSTIINTEKINSLNLSHRKIVLTSEISFTYSCRYSKLIKEWLTAKNSLISKTK